MRQGRWRKFALSIAALTLVPTVPAMAQSIGSAQSINNQVEGILRGNTRALAIGSDVFSNEVVRTGDAASAQLVFLDATNLSVGPRSLVTLDRFVYDPNRNTGRMVVRASRGIFRFVTGSQPKRDYTIHTPVATIGVRGTVFDLLVRSDRTTVVLVEGAIVVTAVGGRTVSLTVPGTAVTIYAGGRIEGPSPWTGPIFDTASNAPFPYFGGGPFQLAGGAPVGHGRIQPFLGLEGGVRSSTTTFDVDPPFDVNSTIGVVGVNGGFLYMPMGTNFVIGPRVGVLLGFGSGSISDAPASPGFTHKVEMPWTVFYEAVGGVNLGPALFSTNARVLGSIGGATTHTKVTSTAGALSEESSTTTTGVTASIGMDFEVSPTLFLGGQLRYINAPTGTVEVPGLVDIHSNSIIGSITLTKMFPQ
jgi:opacity protein-like surface antigen